MSLSVSPVLSRPASDQVPSIPASEAALLATAFLGGGERKLPRDLSQPTALFVAADHAVYWLGIDEGTSFRTNSYLIVDGRQSYVVDPGNRSFFEQTVARVAQVVDPKSVTGLILCHEDPDVAGSLTEWLDLNPSLKVLASPRTHVLLPHYGQGDYPAVAAGESQPVTLPGGGHLRFVDAPFLHFAGAIATYDSRSRFLLSGDIWAAVDVEQLLVVGDFEAHRPKLDLFHLDYMASNIAARGFVRRLKGLTIRAILPQHGPIIGPRHIAAAVDYLANLRCGLDLIYADLAP
jgi:flavorubredoxin